MAKYYSVYNRKTDEPVAIHVTVDEGMAATNLSKSSFYTYAHTTNRNIDIKRRYDIFVDDPEEGDEDG